MLRQRPDRLPNEGRMLTSSLEENPGDPHEGRMLTSSLEENPGDPHT
jgi:hypothetical protein